MTNFLHLFLAFLQVGAFSFGGGYAAMPLIQTQVVDQYGWLTASEFGNLVTISQMTPGPIAINAATFVGNQVAGIPGALVATLGVILPSCILVSILAFLYKKYRDLPLLKQILENLRPTVVALIFSAGLLILIPTLFPSGQEFHLRAFLLFLMALVAIRKFKMNPILAMVFCGIAELLAGLVTG